MKTAGIILIVLSIAALAYQGISYTTQKQVADIAGLKVTETEHHNIPLPPILSGLALAVGIILLMSRNSERTGRRSDGTNVTGIRNHPGGGSSP